MTIAKNTLGYLGVDFQYRLINAFIERPNFFKSLFPIINQNMFTESYLKTIVGVMKDYYNKHDVTASYDLIMIKLREKAKNEDDIQYYEEAIERLKGLTTEGVDEIEDMAERFFKQQNLVRVANEIRRIAGDGDASRYDECASIVEEAMSIGRHDEESMSPLDNVEEDLSKQNLLTIPTGVNKLDDCLGGGLDCGKIGLIMGPTSFGKALADNEIVMTPSGPTMIKNIKVGDKVIGSNGKPVNVIGVFPQGIRDIYKVKFSDGATCRCDKEHIWSVNSVYQKDKDYGHLRNLTLGKMMDKGFRTKDGRHRYRIPLCEGILNDGNKIKDIDDKLNFIFNMNSFGNESDFGEMDYNEILCADIPTRQYALKYFMNRNGIINKGEYPIFFSRSKNFTKFVRQIILSLGGFSDYIPSSNGYRISVAFKNNIALFDNEDLQKNVRQLKGRSGQRFFEFAEFDCKQNAICIKVDAEDELFLTNDYIVTHNTSMTTGFAAYAASYRCPENDMNGYKVLQIVFEDSNRDINRKYFSRLSMVETSKLNESEEITNKVKDILSKHSDRDLIKNNIRVMKLDTGSYSASDVIRKIKKEINKGFKPNMVIIDYLECLEPEHGTSNLPKHEQENKTMRKLENACKELDIALWLPTQGNRDSLSADIVTMDKGAGSIGKQQIAQIVISIARSTTDIKQKRATVSVLKNRSGNAGLILNGIKFDNGTCTITCDDVVDFDDKLAYDDWANEQIENNEKELKKMIMNE